MTHILPCPFCGATARTATDDGVTIAHVRKVWWLRCGDCGGEGPADGRTRKEAIAAWNSRAQLHGLRDALANHVDGFLSRLRFSDDHHLGLGDIRLTPAQQQTIVETIRYLRCNHSVLKGSV